MAILDILRDRQRARQQANPSRQSLRAGIIVEVGNPTYTVNDGVSAVQCHSLIGERLRPGDRVWIGTGDGVALILGVAGTDPNFFSGS